MSYSKKKGFGRGTFMETKMLLSPAYLSLGVNGSLGKGRHVSGASIHILNALLLKRQFTKVKSKKGAGKETVRVDENLFHLTYKELTNKPFNLTRPKITRGFDELLAKGFIKIVNPGGAFDKDKAVYALVDDYKFWKLGDPPIRTRKRDIKRGFQGKNKGKRKRQPTPTLPTHTNADVAHPKARHIH